MRYLWVEDFNDESNGDTVKELQERLIDFFDLQNDKLIVKQDLSLAIDFLENRENFDEIDAVLIDIRFPEGYREDLYITYFKDIVTYDFYDNNILYASGIMFYLLLIFRYHLSQKKMAFLSANISSDNDKLKVIQEMIEIITKSKYTDLTIDDKKSYRTYEDKLGGKFLKISREEKNWDTFISDNDKIENIDIEKLIGQIRQLPFYYHEKFKNNSVTQESIARVKYNEVKAQFDKMGFTMPSAFEKPKIGERIEKKYSFMEWKDKLHRNCYNVVRSNIQEMCILLIEYLEKTKNSDKLYSDFLNILMCDMEETHYFDNAFFVRYLKTIKGMFLIDGEENGQIHFEMILKEITALWEASAKPKYIVNNNRKKRKGVKKGDCFEHEDNCYYACHAITKVMRNWIAHQGIKEINIIDIGLICLLNLRGVFDIENLPKEYLRPYTECENSILDLYEVDERVRDDIKGSSDYFYKLNAETRKGNNSSELIFDKISGLGHSRSKIRREVSMDEIYMLLYHILNDGCEGIYADIKDRIKVRTWKEWKERYNLRFRNFVNIPGVCETFSVK